MKDSEYLHNSKNPAEYISRSIEVNISSGKKAVITRHWLKKTGYSIQDIMYARHRNPYWKKKKHEGHNERMRKRFDLHSYSSGSKIEWTEKRIQRFIEMTEKYHDYQLAKYFHSTIPSIQYLRRRYHYSRLILAKEGKKITPKRLLDLMILGEEKLYKLSRGKK
jgi:hypothetical protein